MRRAKYDIASIHRVTVAEIATEVGIPVKRVRYLLRMNGTWIDDGRRIALKGKPVTYDARVIDVLRGLLGQNHRQLQPPKSDWLSRYLGGTNAK